MSRADVHASPFRANGPGETSDDESFLSACAGEGEDDGGSDIPLDATTPEAPNSKGEASPASSGTPAHDTWSEQCNDAEVAQDDGHGSMSDEHLDSASPASDLACPRDDEATSPARSEADPQDPESMKAQLEDAQAHKEAGNTLFRSGGYEDALAEFSSALKAAPPDAQERAVYHANSAACCMSLHRWHDCVAHCSDALVVDATYQKALMRRMVASEELDELENALRDARQLLELDPSNAKARGNIRKWEPIVHQRQEKMKEEMMGKLKDLGNSVLGHFGMSLDNFKMEKDPTSGGYSIKMQQ